MTALDERTVDAPLDEDRRDCFRMPKPDEQQEAKLKIGKKLVYVQVLDESAGGFLVSATRIPKTEPMESVQLFHATSGAHFLRVAWRRDFDGRTRLGLQRMCQAPPKQESPWLIWLVAAVVLGMGLGFVAASSRHPNFFDRILDRGAVINQIVEDPAEAPAVEPSR